MAQSGTTLTALQTSCPYTTYKKYKVTYDSTQGNGRVVHKADGNNHVFMPSNKGYSILMLKTT